MSGTVRLPSDVDHQLCKEVGFFVCSCHEPLEERVLFGIAMQCAHCGRPLLEYRRPSHEETAP